MTSEPVSSKPSDDPSAGPIAAAPPTEFAPRNPPFWQRPEISGLTALLTSLFFHMSVIGVVLVTYKAYVTFKPVEEEQTIIPDAAIVEGTAVGGIPNPGLGGDPTRPAEQDQHDVLADSQSFSATHSRPLSSSLMTDTDPGAAESSSLIGLGQGGATGSTPGAGQADAGGMSAPLGIPGGGGGIGPRSPFMGISGNATRIAYVCDASGSMVDKIDVLKAELIKSIGVLKPVQSFNIIFFNSQRMPADEHALIIATADNKRKAAAFCTKIAPNGGTDPLSALDLAFRQNAQLIYLLTDGDFEDPDDKAVRDRLKKLNVQHKVKVNTIAFVARREEADRSKDFVEFLRLLAKENGGVSRVVASEDFGK
ncbi:MAG TPA: hypothetical protein VFE58_19715 [Tepidisphaeraceae bacterium]|jgi:hypothetical protein|nr:hypothetical protein [Tepidisphaeraceae bacterium]